MDAKDLIRNRRQITENNAVEHEIQRSEETKTSHTGAPFTYEGRNPATGQIQISNGDVRLSAYSVSNSELTPGTQLQVLDSGQGSPTVNFQPHHPTRPVEPQQSSEEFTGTFAVLLDSIVQGEAPPSCRKLTDIWALFAIVRYVKAARVMVLFSFPVDKGNPVELACPRYNFSSVYVSPGVYEPQCVPTGSIDGTYGTFEECRLANPVSCGGDGFPAGLPLGENGYPSGENCEGAGSYTSPGGTGVLAKFGDFYGVDPGVTTYVTNWYEITYPAQTDPAGTLRPERKSYWRYNERSGGVRPRPEWQPKLINTWTSRSIYAEFYSQKGRAPRCGDTITVDQTFAVWQVSPTTTVKGCDGGTISASGGDETGIQFQNQTVTYSWQFLQVYGFLPVTYSNGCGDFTLLPDPPSPPPPPSNPPPNPPECYPEEGDPSTFERQFWVGGHLQTPIKLHSINAEEEYEYFGSLMPDGYYVTIKWGRHTVNGSEEWCKVQTFKTTNLVDWRTASYHDSKDLNPTLPSGQAGTLISTKNDRANLASNGLMEINPSQTVVGAGGINRTLVKELSTRPEGSFVNTLINAKFDYTPTGGSKVQQSTQIYRIVQVIPASLNTGTVGCIEVGQVEFAFSPLFFIPES